MAVVVEATGVTVLDVKRLIFLSSANLEKMVVGLDKIGNPAKLEKIFDDFDRERDKFIKAFRPLEEAMFAELRSRRVLPRKWLCGVHAWDDKVVCTSSEVREAYNLTKNFVARLISRLNDPLTVESCDFEMHFQAHKNKPPQVTIT